MPCHRLGLTFVMGAAVMGAAVMGAAVMGAAVMGAAVMGSACGFYCFFGGDDGSGDDGAWLR